MKYVGIMVAALMVALYVGRAEAAPDVGLAVICDKAEAEGQHARSCGQRGTTAGVGDVQYNYPTPDSLVRLCEGGQCGWDKPTFRYVKFKDVPNGMHIDTCTSPVEPGARPVYPWSSANDPCKSWGAALKSAVKTAEFAGTVTLKWNAPTHSTDNKPLTAEDITGFHIHRGTSATNLVKLPGSLPATARSFTEGLPVGTYFYAVSAFNEQHEGLLSQVVSIAIDKPAAVPGQPSEVKATVTIRVP